MDSLIEKQYKTSGWNFYNEREHIENLFYSRFNFFLVFFGMFVAAIATFLSSSTTMQNPIIVLGTLLLGILVLLLIQYTLCNIYRTLEIILKIIDGLPPYHSSPIISSLRSRGYTGVILAFVIPSLCVVFLYLILYFFILNHYDEITKHLCLLWGATIIIWLLYLYRTTFFISKRK